MAAAGRSGPAGNRDWLHGAPGGPGETQPGAGGAGRGAAVSPLCIAIALISVASRC